MASGSSDLKRQKSLAWCAFWKLEQLWKSPHMYQLQQKLSCIILLVSLYYSMAANHGWSPRIWKTKSAPLLPHATESCWIESALTMFWTPPYIPWLTLCLWFTWLGTASWNFLVTSSKCQRKSLLEDICSLHLNHWKKETWLTTYFIPYIYANIARG